MKRKNILFRYAILFVLVSLIGACTTEDLDPSLEQNKLVKTSIVEVNNLHAIIKGTYSWMTSDAYYGRDYIINNEVRSDNCFSNGNSGRFTTEAGFNYSPNTAYFWDEAYSAIANANIIIATDVATLDGDQDRAKHIKGQAYAIRALIHFDLLKQYGQRHTGGTLGVPYVTEFKGDDWFPARNTIEECRVNILNDLQTAFDLMDASYDISSEFISKYAAKAIESNVAVYFEMWDEAIAASEAVINTGDYSIIAATEFVKSYASDLSANSIFELAFNSTDNGGNTSLAYIYRGSSYGDVQVLDTVSYLFEAGDVRGDILGYEGDMLRNIGKFPNNQGYDNVPVIRYEEIIINYAEALWRAGQTSGIGLGTPLEILNMIPSNRGASLYTAINEDNILMERRKEFMFEGKRFEDLIRFERDIPKISLQQNFTATVPYGDYRLAWPIPQWEMDANSNMVQNDGF